MPAGGGKYVSREVGGSVATVLKRQPMAKRSLAQVWRSPEKAPAKGKFGGLPGGPSGGDMTKGRGKKG